MTKMIVDLLGWAGAAAYLLAYYLVSTRKLEGNSVLFQGMNILGGVLLVLNSTYYHVWPSAALNAIWVLIGVFVILRRMMPGRGEA